MEGNPALPGCIKYPPDYWQRLRALADKHGILLIADEGNEGGFFGRTGKWFGIDHSGVVPDIMAMAKESPQATCRLEASLFPIKLHHISTTNRLCWG